MADDIRSLTAALAAGDAGAIAAFYRAEFEWLYLLARKATGRDEAFCLDVVQEAMLKIVRCIKPIDTERHLRAWLRLVVRTTAYDLLRAERRQTTHLREAAYVTTGPAESPDDRLDWLAAELAKLDPAIRQLIDMRYTRGWTLRRIAEALGVKTGTVDGRLRRALASMREGAEIDDE